MKLAYLLDSETHENRVSLIPDHAKLLIEKGFSVAIESGLGQALFDDTVFKTLGVSVESKEALLKTADCVIRLGKPESPDLKQLKKNAIHISFLDPFNEPALINQLKEAHVTAISLEMIPRTTRAQKMDVLSSQASLAGYVAVIVGSDALNRVLPMMMTPAGTLAPSKVFVIGAGVAGLQAIATAKRLGARVEAFDTRPVVEEQVQSLGAKFVKVDLGKMEQTKDGYAKPLTEAQLTKQREVMAKHCAQADIVITTAQLFGRKAPVIITKEMIDAMKKGSVVVDLAVESGGNVVGSKPGEVVETKNGVKLIGMRNLPGKVAAHASQMLSSNIVNLLTEFWNAEEKTFGLDLSDDILSGCVITSNGELVNQQVKGGA